MIRSFLVGAVAAYAGMAGLKLSSPVEEPLQSVPRAGDGNAVPVALQIEQPVQVEADIAVPTEDLSSDVRITSRPSFTASSNVYTAQRPLQSAPNVYPSDSKDGLGDIIEGIALIGEDVAVNYLTSDETEHECREMCRQDGGCQGWTFVENRRQADGLHKCYLKGGTTTPVEQAGSSSGIRIPPSMMRSGGVQYAVNYFSGDLLGGGYRGEMSLAQCASSCRDSSTCVAYTLVLPDNERPVTNAERGGSGAPVATQQKVDGAGGPPKRPAVASAYASSITGGCWHKRFAPIPYPSDCCISGIPHPETPGRRVSAASGKEAEHQMQQQERGKSTGDRIADVLLPWRW